VTTARTAADEQRRARSDGLLGYGGKPPAASLNDALELRQLCDLLDGAGSAIVSTEAFRDGSRIPVEYVRAVRT